MTDAWRTSLAAFCKPACYWLPPSCLLAAPSISSSTTPIAQIIVRSAAHFHSEGLIQIGLLLLIATPVARVAMAMVGFALERDRLYMVVSLIVLLILAFSLVRAT